MRPRHVITSAGLAVLALTGGCATHSTPAATTQPYTPPTTAPAAAAAIQPGLTTSCIVGWDLNPSGNFTATPPPIPGNVPFSQLDAFNYSDQGAPWLSSSWKDFLSTMEASEITLSNPSDGAMTPTESATVVYYSANGTELASGNVSIVNAELMPGQSSTAEDFPPQGTSTCQVVAWQ